MQMGSGLSGTGGAVIAEFNTTGVPEYGNRRQTARDATGGPLTRQATRICSVFTSETATLPIDRRRTCCRWPVRMLGLVCSSRLVRWWHSSCHRPRSSAPRRNRLHARMSRAFRSTGRACSHSMVPGGSTSAASSWSRGKRKSWRSTPVTSRGLFHSDGCRAINRVRRPLKDGDRWYEYPRYLFENHSADIHRLCGQALDRLGVAWRFSRPTTISVARHDAVARLDEFVGPKY
jgi:hypothetical protein